MGGKSRIEKAVGLIGRAVDVVGSLSGPKRHRLKLTLGTISDLSNLTMMVVETLQLVYGIKSYYLQARTARRKRLAQRLGRPAGPEAL